MCSRHGIRLHPHQTSTMIHTYVSHVTTNVTVITGVNPYITEGKRSLHVVNSKWDRRLGASFCNKLIVSIFSLWKLGIKWSTVVKTGNRKGMTFLGSAISRKKIAWSSSRVLNLFHSLELSGGIFVALWSQAARKALINTAHTYHSCRLYCDSLQSRLTEISQNVLLLTSITPDTLVGRPRKTDRNLFSAAFRGQRNYYTDHHSYCYWEEKLDNKIRSLF